MKTLYKFGEPFEIEEYPTIEAGIEAKMSHKEDFAAFLVGADLWSIYRATPYGMAELLRQGFRQFGGDLAGTTIGYSESPENDTELI